MAMTAADLEALEARREYNIKLREERYAKKQAEASAMRRQKKAEEAERKRKRDEQQQKHFLI